MVSTAVVVVSSGAVDVFVKAMVVSVKDVVSTVLEFFFFAELVTVSAKVVFISAEVVGAFY